MFSEDLECQKLLMEAMKYHLLPERRPMLQSPRTKPRKSTVGSLYAVGGMDASKGGPLFSSFLTFLIAVPLIAAEFLIYLIQSLRNSLTAISRAACNSTTNNKLRVCLLLGSTTIEKYDLRTNKWIQVGIMNGRRLQFGVAVIDNKLYVVGGRDGLKTSNMVECYNPITKVWSTMPPMSTHRHGLGVFFECFRCLSNFACSYINNCYAAMFTICFFY